MKKTISVVLVVAFMMLLMCSCSNNIAKSMENAMICAFFGVLHVAKKLLANMIKYTEKK